MIGLLNADVDLVLMLKNTRRDTLDINIGIGIPSNLKGLYIDWLQKPEKGKSKEYVYQAAILDRYIKKKIPIVIFDRYMCITDGEYKWLSKYNVTLYEPALNNRVGFNYMPFPIDIDKYESQMLEIEEPTPRSIDIGLKGDVTKSSSFNKYIVDYIKKQPDKNVVYNDENLDWDDVKWTVAIDSSHNYQIGHLDHNIIESVKHGCSVIIPKEHKYYIGLFNHIYTPLSFLHYFVANYSDTMRLYDNIARLDNMRKIYPEFDMKNVADTILEILG